MSKLFEGLTFHAMTDRMKIQAFDPSPCSIDPKFLNIAVNPRQKVVSYNLKPAYLCFLVKSTAIFVALKFIVR